MEVLNYGKKISKEEYLRMQEYALGKLFSNYQRSKCCHSRERNGRQREPVLCPFKGIFVAPLFGRNSINFFEGSGKMQLVCIADCRADFRNG